MNDLEQMIMDEISTLDEMRLIDILGFIRYLKAEKPLKQDWITDWFDHAAKSIREREKEFKLTPDDIQEQVNDRKHKGL
ncbi:MAG: hypothetical protein JNK32_01785 [Anaerolineales bacterium]|nr:hypothetical protein [Anaerolineales bacterium]